MKFEIVVIGNDEGAFELTRQAARQGRRVALVAPEKRHSAWMVQQGVQRLLRITTDSMADRNRLPEIARRSPPFLLERLLARSIHDVQQELLVSLALAGAAVVCGEPVFLSANTLEIVSTKTPARRQVTSDWFAVATGIRLQPETGQNRLADAWSLETVVRQPRIPRIIRLFGSHPLVGDLKILLRRFDIQVSSTEGDQRLPASGPQSAPPRPVAAWADRPDGKLPANAGSAARIIDVRRVVGFTRHLRLAALGVLPDEHGQLWCSDTFRTWCSSVYGFGNVVGFPELRELTLASAATRLLDSMHDQSRVSSVPAPSFLRRTEAAEQTH